MTAPHKAACNPNIGLAIDLESHILPVLHLARMAISMEHMLREIDAARALLPKLNDTLKNLGCLTDSGQPVAPDADGAILLAISLLETYAEDKRVGGAE
jgi:hypothetical protein